MVHTLTFWTGYWKQIIVMTWLVFCWKCSISYTESRNDWFQTTPPRHVIGASEIHHYAFYISTVGLSYFQIEQNIPPFIQTRASPCGYYHYNYAQYAHHLIWNGCNSVIRIPYCYYWRRHYNKWTSNFPMRYIWYCQHHIRIFIHGILRSATNFPFFEWIRAKIVSTNIFKIYLMYPHIK